MIIVVMLGKVKDGKRTSQNGVQQERQVVGEGEKKIECAPMYVLHRTRRVFSAAQTFVQTGKNDWSRKAFLF